MRPARRGRRRGPGDEHQGRRRAPDHRRLPVRQGLRLPGARVLARAAPPPARPRGREGRGQFPPGDLGRGARRRGAGAAARDRTARCGLGRAVQLSRHAGSRAGRRDGQPTVRRDRRIDARAHHLRERRRGRHDGDQRGLARGRPRGMGARAHDRRVGLEPALDGTAPVAPDPRGASPRCAAHRGGSLPQPHGARRRRARTTAAGHGRGTRARRHAGAARRRPRRRGVVPSARSRLRRPGRAPRRRVGRGPRSTVRSAGRRRARARAGARAGPAVADPPRRRRAAARGSADRLPHGRLHPGACGLLAPPRRRALVHPDGHVRRAPRGASRAAAPARGHRAVAQHVAHRRGADRPGARSAGGGADRLELEPGCDRARSGTCPGGPARARICSRSCASSS